MNVEVTAVGAEDRGPLEALFELYVYDFSELLGLDVEDDGRFEIPSLDNYWADPRSHPFLLRVDGKLGGFALVQEVSRLTGDTSVRDVAEFFVLRRYRRNRVGERAASWLFDRFPGRWEVRQKTENVAATAFWRRTVRRYTGDRFDDVVWNDEQWKGPVQRFVSGPAASRA